MRKGHYGLGWLLFLVTTGTLAAQQTTGSVRGVVRDESGGVLRGVEITVLQPETNRRIRTVSGPTGAYLLRSLPAGPYRLTAQLPGFKTSTHEVVVQVGTRTGLDVTLTVGEISEEVTVVAHQATLDNSTATVAGVVTDREVKGIPLNGRNFLDLAQTEPGVQLVDAGNFDPTKNQMTGVSIGGRGGRATRITVDGIDITDEFVGTTIQNISIDGIQEFQVSQSSLDPSTSLTSSGAVNIITRSGNNGLHGSAFVFYRDEEIAALPASRTGDAETVRQLESAEFDREQGGFNLGGPIIRDRLFYFLNYEKLNQDGTTFISSPLFPQFNQAVSTPYNDNMGLGRLDWDPGGAAALFFRFAHETNDAATGFGGGGLAPYSSQNVSNVAAAGLDVSNPRLSHSIRYGHSGFDVEVSSADLGLPEFKAANGVGLSLAIGDDLGAPLFMTGPNFLAPQADYITSDQWKYDGGWYRGGHNLRYGGEISYTRANGFGALFSEGPLVFVDYRPDEVQARGGDPDNPLEYPVSVVLMGNGKGYFTEIANQGRDLGGLNSTRLSWYLSDSWRVRPSFTLDLGVRYELETGKVTDDLPLPVELSGLLGERGIRPTRLDTNNFGPRIGFAWAPFAGKRTVVRAGAGVFYETELFVRTALDRVLRLPAGLGFSFIGPPSFGVNEAGQAVVGGVPVNGVNTGAWLGASLQTSLDQIGQVFYDYQQASAAIDFDPSNPPLILFDGNTGAGALFVQDFSTPYGFQANIGIQHQLGRDLVLSADYVRNRSVHHNLSRDFNRWHAADTLDVEAAKDGVQAVLDYYGVGSVDEAIQCGGGFSDYGMGRFFVGEDPSFQEIQVVMTSGLSTYQALQVRLNGSFERPFPGVKNLFAHVGYSLGRFEGMSGEDQDLRADATFNDNYFQKRNFGPTGLDRTHQLSALFFAGLPWGLGINVNHRWATPLAGTLYLPAASGGDAADEIFYTDLDGDGTVGDMLPGTSRGAFGRSIGTVGALNQAIEHHNANVAGRLTPAAQALVQAGLFTEAQLLAMGVVVPPVSKAAADQVMNDSFFSTDMRVTKRFDLGDEGASLDALVEVFNLFNVANYGPLQGPLSGVPGTVNGTVAGNRTNRLGLGSGSFSQGIPRAVQFGLRLRF